MTVLLAALALAGPPACPPARTCALITQARAALERTYAPPAYVPIPRALFLPRFVRVPA